MVHWRHAVSSTHSRVAVGRLRTALLGVSNPEFLYATDVTASIEFPCKPITTVSLLYGAQVPHNEMSVLGLGSSC